MTFGRLRLLPAFLLVVGLASAGSASPAQEPEPFDVIVRGGHVYDGSGNPWITADVGVRNDSIVAVGNLDGMRATVEIDATGDIVTPGFIDLHSHADEGRVSLANPDAAAAPNLVSQGITTVVVGQDGRCQCPVAERTALYRQHGIGINVVQLVGHGTIRQQVMGREPRAATDAEIATMSDIVRRMMSEGAAGLSSGLEYNPGRFSVTEEVIALALVVGEFGGFYISHERSEGRTPMWWYPSNDERPMDLIDAVQETIRIGEASGIPVVASHIKVKGADYWGTAPTVTRLIDEARGRGVQMYADQYPYTTTGSDGSTVLVPRWSLAAESAPEGGDDFDASREAFRTRLADAETEQRIRADIIHEISRRGGPDKLLIIESHNPEFVGQTLDDIAAAQGLSAVDTAVMLQLEGLDRPGGARIRGFSLDERDVEHFMSQEYTATSTDAGIALAGIGMPHPRFYGTYPRKFRRYVLDGSVLSMAQAVRASTSLPAQIVGLSRRGQIRPGFAADIVVFDGDSIADHATAMKPHQRSTGVETVLINGEFAVRDGVPTGALAGNVLEGAEFTRRPPDTSNSGRVAGRPRQ